MGMASGFGGGEFTKALCGVCTCRRLKCSFLLLEYCRVRECCAVASAFTIRNMCGLLLYMGCSSRRVNRPTKDMTRIVTLLHFWVVLDRDASWIFSVFSSWESGCGRGWVPIRQRWVEVWMSLQAVSFLVLLLGGIGSGGAHCECMRGFAGFVGCFLQD